MALTPEQHRLRDGKKNGPIPRGIKSRILDNMCPEPNSGCWLWLGYIRNSGYGLIGVGSRKDGTATMRSVHRESYECFIGPIPNGMVVRHKCDVRICVNPAHLALGTQCENVADMVGRDRNYWGRQTHCKRGHEFTPANTRARPDGGRRCIACARAAVMRHYYKGKSKC